MFSFGTSNYAKTLDKLWHVLIDVYVLLCSSSLKSRPARSSHVNHKTEKVFFPSIYFQLEHYTSKACTHTQAQEYAYKYIRLCKIFVIMPQAKQRLCFNNFFLVVQRGSNFFLRSFAYVTYKNRNFNICILIKLVRYLKSISSNP